MAKVAAAAIVVIVAHFAIITVAKTVRPNLNTNYHFTSCQKLPIPFALPIILVSGSNNNTVSKNNNDENQDDGGGETKGDQ